MENDDGCTLHEQMIRIVATILLDKKKQHLLFKETIRDTFRDTSTNSSKKALTMKKVKLGSFLFGTGKPFENLAIGMNVICWSSQQMLLKKSKIFQAKKSSKKSMTKF